jgi:hypothetical protein
MDGPGIVRGTTMKLISIAALAVAFAFSAAPANAAAWQTSVEDGDSYYVGWVDDTLESAQLSIDCDAELMEHSVVVIMHETWDTSRTYPDNVPVRFVIDSAIVAEIVFESENAGGKVAIAAYEDDRPEIYDLILSLSLARETIDVSFLDRNLRFSAENVIDAASTVIDACGF